MATTTAHGGITIQMADEPRWIRFSAPGTGGRSVDLHRLAEVVQSDTGWERLCVLFAADLDDWSDTAQPGGEAP